MEIGVDSFVMVVTAPKTVRLPTWLCVGGTPESFVRIRTVGLPLMAAVLAAVSSASGNLLISIDKPGRPAFIRLGKKGSSCMTWVSSLIPTRVLRNQTLGGPSRIIFRMNPAAWGDRSLTALDRIVRFCCRASGDAHGSSSKRDRLWVS